MAEIKELREEFEGEGEVRGFTFRRVLSNGYAYVYMVSGGSSRDYYEVFERRVNSTYGVVSYPKSKAFGVWAKTTYDWDKALAYYGEFTMRVMSRSDVLDEGF
jgi:hypothetical protein